MCARCRCRQTPRGAYQTPLLRVELENMRAGLDKRRAVCSRSGTGIADEHYACLLWSCCMRARDKATGRVKLQELQKVRTLLPVTCTLTVVNAWREMVECQYNQFNIGLVCSERGQAMLMTSELYGSRHLDAVKVE